MTQTDGYIGGIPLFDPIRHPEEQAWQPLNEAARLRVHVGHVWRDLITLLRIRNERTDAEERALLLKHVVVEIRSLLEGPFDNLKKVVVRAPDRATTHGNSLSRSERDEARRLFKAYDGERKRIEKQIIDLRNEVGAHRGLKRWDVVVKHWHALSQDPERFLPLLRAVGSCLEFIWPLDLFQWARRTESGAAQLIQFKFRPGDIQLVGRAETPRQPGT